MCEITDRQIEYAENFNLTDVTTPVNVDRLEQLLQQTHYDADKTEKLIAGFKDGFDIGFGGNRLVQRTAKNLKFTIGDRTDLWNKVMKEVKLQRYAGPFVNIPFKYYIQSPIGLVPKDNGKSMRLIFHLSHPRNGKMESVNANTPPELSKVRYLDFCEAIKRCLEEGIGCHLLRSDFSAAFRNLGI